MARKGNTRMDAALDAMRQLGFEKKLVRKTVTELLDVYEGTQGWPFIEEACYKLLIETILGKQQSYAEEKEDSLQDNARRDDVTETSSAVTPTTGITEVDSSNLVAQDSLLQTARTTEVGSSTLVAQDTHDGLDSASQTNDQDSASLGNLETVFVSMLDTQEVKDTTVATDRGGHEQGIRVESKNEQKPVDNVKSSSASTFVSNVKSTFLRSSMIESSKTQHENLPCRRHKQIEMLFGHSEAPQSGSRRRRKSRWDEKPDGL
ncbi:WIYLD domain [Sesbania bispinosa]|nr:WIYLD domain [Sesbania bispinosa]